MKLKQLFETRRRMVLDEAGAGPSRVFDHLQSGRPAIIISAFRSQYSMSENRERMKELRKDLTSRGFGVIKVDGIWEDSGEPSFIAVARDENIPVGELVDIALELDRKYDQDAVIVFDGEVATLYAKDGSVIEVWDHVILDRRDLAKMPGKTKVKNVTFSFAPDAGETQADHNFKLAGGE